MKQVVDMPKPRPSDWSAEVHVWVGGCRHYLEAQPWFQFQIKLQSLEFKRFLMFDFSLTANDDLKRQCWQAVGAGRAERGLKEFQQTHAHTGLPHWRCCGRKHVSSIIFTPKTRLESLGSVRLSPPT